MLDIWLKVPTTYEERDQQIAYLFSVISLGLFIAGVLYSILLPLLTGEYGRLLLPVSIIFVTVFVRVQIAHGRLYFGVGVFLFALWLVITLGVATRGGLRHPGFSAYFMLIVMASFFLNQRMTLMVVGICILTSFALLVLEKQDILPRTEDDLSIEAVWVVQLFIIAIVALLLLLTTKVMQGFIAALRSQKMQLLERNQQLKLTIEQQEQTQVQLSELVKTNESNAKLYQSLFNQNNDAIFILDLQGNHIAVNNRASSLLGYSVEELLQLSARDMVVEEEVQHSQSVLQRLLDRQTVTPYERRFRKKDGTTLLVEVSVELVYDVNGNPLHLQSICRDITERKQLEAEQLASAVAQERTTLLSNIISTVSHDFRTPLSTIYTRLHLLDHVQDDPKRRAHYLKSIATQTDIMSRMVDNLLMLIGLNNQHDIQLIEVDMEKLISDCINQYSQKAEITIKTEIVPTLPKIHAAPDLLIVTLYHLIDNARHHAESSEAIVVKVNPHPDTVSIEVVDQGKGIEPRQLEDIFKHFYRADEARTPSTNSSNGMGLPIVKRIIDLHSGQIEVESIVGQGSTFRLCLPIREAAKANVS